MTRHDDKLRQVDVNQTPRSSEVATLMRATQRSGAEGLDIALCGVPFDGGSSFRAGARHGPAQIREMSRLIRRAHHLTGTAPFDLCRIADIGDAPVNPLDMDATLQSIQAFFEDIRDAGARALVAGGDHTVTLPILRAIARDGPIALLQIDAHSDTQDRMLGQRYANGTPIRRAIEEGLVDPRRTVQIGIRGTLFAADELDWARQQGVTIINIDELYALGQEEVIARSRKSLGSGPCYVTVDIDVLDPAYAPGTGGLEPGGMNVRELQSLIRGFAGLDIAAADVTEVSPPLDPTGITALAACSVMFELLCLLASDTAPG
ncbi:MAG TPA: agmatinase [Acidobacteriota bacterium]|nr:agmatinase [Acidobacteriota bacterium]